MNLALLSPSKDAYSETFIRAQKELLPFQVFYYFDGFLPRQLEGKGSIVGTGWFSRLFGRVQRKFGNSSLNFYESALEKSFKENKIDVVLAQYGPAGVAVLSICKLLDIPLIVHFHGYDASVYDLINRNQNNYSQLFNYAKSIFAVSKVMSKKLVEMGCNPAKIATQPCAPNDSFFTIVPDFSKPRFIGIGRFTDKKAPYYTILAFSKVLKHFPEARLTIGGNGELFNTCINLVKYLQIGHAVNLPGVIQPEEFRKYLQESVAFVQHSIIAQNGDSEGTPVAVLEACAAGLPVIATKHAGIPDVIVNGKTGLLVDEHDVDGMARAMMKVLENSALAMVFFENRTRAKK